MGTQLRVSWSIIKFAEFVPPQNETQNRLFSIVNKSCIRYLKHNQNYQIQIKVYDLANGFYGYIIDSSIDQPTSIVVDPSAGLIFWIDAGSEARIERAGMNGGDRLAIAKEPALKWPVGLTIDILDRRLYWVDVKLKSVRSSDYYGGDLRTVLHSHSIIRHPFSMVAFEDRLYLSDRDQASILSVDKFDGGNLEVMFNRLSGPTTLRVYHENLQPEQRNLCANHTCSQLCLPMATMRASTPERESADSSSPDLTPFMCRCSSDFTTDPKNHSKCIRGADGDEDEGASTYHVPSSRRERRRSIFSTLAILALICLVVGGAYYWYRNRRPRYTNFVQFENPAFEN